MEEIYVSDLDGTLLDTHARLPLEVREALNRLISQGLRFTVATARSFASARAILDGLELGLPMLTYNGSFLVEPANGRIVSAELFRPEQVCKAREVFEQEGLWPLVYALRGGQERVSRLPGTENAGVRAYLASRPGDKRMREANGEDDLYGGDVFYFNVIGTREELSAAADSFAAMDGFACTFQRELYGDGEYWLEVMPAGATKAGGVRRLRELLGGRIVCFGDGMNDMPMFRAADESYAVANAAEDLKRCATGVIGANTEGGVVRFLQERF